MSGEIGDLCPRFVKKNALESTLSTHTTPLQFFFLFLMYNLHDDGEWKMSLAPPPRASSVCGVVQRRRISWKPTLPSSFHLRISRFFPRGVGVWGGRSVGVSDYFQNAQEECFLPILSTR